MGGSDHGLGQLSPEWRSLSLKAVPMLSLWLRVRLVVIGLSCYGSGVRPSPVIRLDAFASSTRIIGISLGTLRSVDEWTLPSSCGFSRIIERCLCRCTAGWSIAIVRGLVGLESSREVLHGGQRYPVDGLVPRYRAIRRGQLLLPPR